MIRHYRLPRAPLRDFIELLWLYDEYVLPHAQERLLPTATTELVFDLRPDARGSASALVAGPHSRHFVLDTHAERSVLGVHFRVGGAFALLGVPSAELHNRQLPLEALWGARAAIVREQILAAPAPQARFDIIERELAAGASQFARHGAVRLAIAALSTESPACTVADVTARTGLSHRRFLDHFRHEVGMTPKLFARVQRFQSVVRRVHGLATVDWAAIAAECGYFDQSHFVHDFRDFTGLTPGDYLARRGEHPNHVPVRK